MPSVREFGSRRLMANPGAGDKCANATAAMRNRVRGSMALLACPAKCGTCRAAVALAYFALSAAVFLHSDMNFFRSLPCKLLPSASFEHSRDAAVRAGLSAFFSAGAAFVAGAGVAAVCANAELIRNRDATTVAAARVDIVIMGN